MLEFLFNETKDLCLNYEEISKQFAKDLNGGDEVLSKT